jgi:hypothetical protein
LINSLIFIFRRHPIIIASTIYGLGIGIGLGLWLYLRHLRYQFYLTPSTTIGDPELVKSASKCFIILLLLIAIYSIIGLIPLLRHLSKLKGLVEKTPS